MLNISKNKTLFLRLSHIHSDGTVVLGWLQVYFGLLLINSNRAEDHIPQLKVTMEEAFA